MSGELFVSRRLLVVGPFQLNVMRPCLCDTFQSEVYTSTEVWPLLFF